MTILSRSCSNAWAAAFAAVKKGNKSQMVIQPELTFEENQGIYIHSKLRQKLGLFFQARFAEYAQSIDDSVTDLSVGKGVDLISNTDVCELKLQSNTDNDSSRKHNLKKLKTASDGIKTQVYGYLFSEISKVVDDVYYLGGIHLFSHFNIEHLYTQFMEEIADIRVELADAYREQFKQRYTAETDT